MYCPRACTCRFQLWTPLQVMISLFAFQSIIVPDAQGIRTSAGLLDCRLNNTLDDAYCAISFAERSGSLLCDLDRAKPPLT